MLNSVAVDSTPHKKIILDGICFSNNVEHTCSDVLGSLCLVQ